MGNTLAAQKATTDEVDRFEDYRILRAEHVEINRGIVLILLAGDCAMDGCEAMQRIRALNTPHAKAAPIVA